MAEHFYRPPVEWKHIANLMREPNYEMYKLQKYFPIMISLTLLLAYISDTCSESDRCAIPHWFAFYFLRYLLQEAAAFTLLFLGCVLL